MSFRIPPVDAVLRVSSKGLVSIKYAAASDILIPVLEHVFATSVPPDYIMIELLRLHCQDKVARCPGH